jgi:hypothetical protein
MKKTTCAIAAVAVFLALALKVAPLHSTPESDVDFQIVADKHSYDPGSVLHVKFIVLNNGETPLLLYRAISNCGSQYGFVGFTILDHEGRPVDTTACSGDSWPPLQQVDALKVVSDSKLWILLRQGELYGGVADFDLPKKRGVYRLSAELIPPAFTEDQKAILLQNRARILSRYKSPIVTIGIK